MGERTDGELVLAARRGDRDAYGELVRRHVRVAGAAAYAVVGDYEQAADVVQEALLKAYRRLDDLREPERFRAWLYGVVRRAAYDALRRTRRRAEVALEPAHAEGCGSDPRPLEALARRDAAERVREAVGALPDGYREVVALKYLEGASYEEIAALLGTSVSAVESRLHRARRMLRNKLGRLWREQRS